MIIRRRHSLARGSSAAPPAPLAPTYRVSTYTVFPSGYDQVDDPSRSRWCLTVADAGDGWVIRRGDECLNFFNQWERDVPPEMRDAEFRRLCLYNEHAALLRARRVIDSLDVGGFTFEEFVWNLQVAASEDASDSNDRAVEHPPRPRDAS